MQKSSIFIFRYPLNFIILINILLIHLGFFKVETGKTRIEQFNKMKIIKT